MVQISTPSRSRIPEYVEEKNRVDQIVGRVNGKFSEAGWAPIHYLYRSYTQQEVAGFYRQADVCLVTPLRDGLNLVAKEFVACQGDDPGVLVLSRFAGAAEQMPEALIVNPYDMEDTAEAIYRALTMPVHERRRRIEALKEGVYADTAQSWRLAFLSDLADAPTPSDAPPPEESLLTALPVDPFPSLKLLPPVSITPGDTGSGLGGTFSILSAVGSSAAAACGGLGFGSPPGNAK